MPVQKHKHGARSGGMKLIELQSLAEAAQKEGVCCVIWK
jgi:hypothetical protein